MTREEAIKFASHAQSLTDIPEVKEFYALAETALREQAERENPKPLTLDELRQMDGEPVWLETGEVSIGEQICGSWEIFIGRESAIYYFTRRKRGFFAEHYGKTWLAYRSKPKEDDDAKMQ